jgi:nicotinate-nucleotide pyrophosphorylase (carboxylating)
MSRLDPPDMKRVVAMIRAALDEDGAGHDVTSAFVGLGERVAAGVIHVSAPITLCGIDVAREVFQLVDAASTFHAFHHDGERVPEGEAFCRVEGKAASIMAAERTALNFLQRLCGVATLASRFVDAVRGTGVVILDTRKTIPLWRELDKYAVRCGGAQNHRRALDAMVLIKDNHVRAIGGPERLVEMLAQRTRAGEFVEVEVDSIDVLNLLLPAGVDRIMLDNFTPGQVGDAVKLVRAFRAAQGRSRPEIEVSGGITLENVCDYAQPGVDYISIGAITHSAPAASMSLDLQ